MNYTNSLLTSTIGFDRLFRLIDTFNEDGNTKPSYPHYNICKSDKDTHLLEIAVAGFKRENLSIELDRDNLIIVGDQTEEKRDYVYHGLAARKFRKVFTIAENVVVDSADLEDGLLKIKLRTVAPENERIKKIPIGQLNEVAPPRMLTE
jgi:molecular chaperone IbpA